MAVQTIGSLGVVLKFLNVALWVELIIEGFFRIGDYSLGVGDPLLGCHLGETIVAIWRTEH